MAAPFGAYHRHVNLGEPLTHAFPEGEVVLSGSHGALHWRVRVFVRDDDLMTMLDVFDGPTLVACSGFGGTALPAGSRINYWYGKTDDLPTFAMARTDPTVSRVTLQTDRGRQIDLKMSDVIPAFALRFAAGALPDQERPVEFLVD